MVQPIFDEPPATGPGASFDPRRLELMSDSDLDQLSFGVIALDSEGTVLRYNQYESRLARLDRNQVIGKDFFAEVAPCTRTADFQGRFQSYVSGGGADSLRFSYVFDFRFGAQEVDVELIRPGSLDRFYLLINRRQFRSVRPEGIPAPLQSQLAPGELSLGVKRDGLEQRVMQLPSVFFAGLKATCDRLAPETWPMFCSEWGVEWGRRAAIDLEAQYFQTHGKPLSELPMRRVGEILDGWFREQGLGSLVLDFSFSAQGCLVAELQRSALAEVSAGRAPAGGGEQRPQCALLAGCLSALLTQVAGHRLIARELRCGTGAPAICSFVVVGRVRSQALEELLSGGERDVRRLIEQLSTKAAAVG